MLAHKSPMNAVMHRVGLAAGFLVTSVTGSLPAASESPARLVRVAPP